LKMPGRQALSPAKVTSPMATGSLGPEITCWAWARKPLGPVVTLRRVFHLETPALPAESAIEPERSTTNITLGAAIAALISTVLVCSRAALGETVGRLGIGISKQESLPPSVQE